MDAPQPRRFQFGLRALMLAFVPVAIVALPFGWYLRRPGPPRTVPVSGTITLDGAPLFGVVVFFHPVDHAVGRMAEGCTGRLGKFTLRTESAEGAVPSAPMPVE
jgi:hypothetical protein